MRQVTDCAVEVLPWDAPRDEWLAARRAGVGSSDIAVLLGLSNWDSPFGLYHRKTGALGEQDELERMYWGRKLEAVVADEFAERHESEYGLERCGLVRNTERPYQQATPDRLLYEASRYVGEPVGVLEVKTDESMDGWGPDGTDEIPVKYRAQALWQADCLGLPGTHLAALLPSKRYREYYVERDETDLKLMREAAEAFMDRIRRGEPPDVDDAPATTGALRRLHPDLEDAEVILTRTLAARYRGACRNVKRAEASKRLIENRIRARMGAARTALDPDGGKLATRSVYEVREHIRAAHKVDKLIPKEPA